MEEENLKTKGLYIIEERAANINEESSEINIEEKNLINRNGVHVKRTSKVEKYEPQIYELGHAIDEFIYYTEYGLHSSQNTPLKQTFFSLKGKSLKFVNADDEDKTTSNDDNDDNNAEYTKEHTI